MPHPPMPGSLTLNLFGTLARMSWEAKGDETFAASISSVFGKNACTMTWCDDHMHHHTTVAPCVAAAALWSTSQLSRWPCCPWQPCPSGTKQHTNLSSRSP